MNTSLDELLYIIYWLCHLRGQCQTHFIPSRSRLLESIETAQVNVSIWRIGSEFTAIRIRVDPIYAASRGQLS